MSLCPLEFTWLSLHLEVFVTFRTAKSEEFGIVANKRYTFGWVYRPRAEMAIINPTAS